MTYAIKILDSNGSLIGKLVAATSEDVMKFINKGLIVIDIATNEQITMEMITSKIGVSDGFIDVG